MERLEALDEARALLDQMQGLSGAATQRRYTDCLRAVGHEPFCSCLRDQSPFLASFENYVEVVTHTKDELGYDELEPDLQGMVDGLVDARETCVARSF